MPVGEVDTPALLVELDAFESNLRRMADAVTQAGVRLRPHAKTHKCASIARRQIALGAVGVCCQKVSEAEALVDAGIEDVLVSNQVIGARKLARLAALAGRARIGVCVDHALGVAELARAVAAAGSEVWVLVEIDVGARRCGVGPGAPAVELALQVSRCPGLHFAGLQAYQGSAQHRRAHAERRQLVDTAVALTRQTVAELADQGLECEVVAGAGTGTFRFEAASGVFNELQCGSYIFLDRDYAQNLDESGTPGSEFQHSLFLLSTVMSVPREHVVIVDAGLKSMTFDAGLPAVHAPAGADYERASDEHGRIDTSDCNLPPQLGDRVWLIPGHCDPTVNLHDWIVAVRNGVVEEVWPVEARGALF
jgi:D-serine deaminase-like pyridoxal phosphate-dependent protein